MKDGKFNALITAFIGIVSVFVMIKANNIARTQALVAKNLTLPTFEVDESIADNRITGEENSCIEIYNIDGKMNNYQSRIITFLECDYADTKENVYKSCTIPVISYYFSNTTYGTTHGLIECAESVGNYAMMEQLEKDTLDFDLKSDTKSISIELQSYLTISYLDVLGKMQQIYYVVDSGNSKILDVDVGKSYFENYDSLVDTGCVINTNKMQSISVDELIKTILESPEDNQIKNKKLKEKKRMPEYVGDIIIPLISTVIGAIVSFAVLYCQTRSEKKKMERQAAALLFYDLKSVEDYLQYEELNVNLRYSEEWQDMLSKCLCLKSRNIQKLYKIYDAVYNYNYYYEHRMQDHMVKKEDWEYKSLYKEIYKESNTKEYNEVYKQVMDELEAYMKNKRCICVCIKAQDC